MSSMILMRSSITPALWPWLNDLIALSVMMV
jgi:hypothetical protein